MLKDYFATGVAAAFGLNAMISQTPPAASMALRIKKYAPAITATGGGLYMALINILPSWVVGVGRDLIRGLAGVAPPDTAEGQS